MLTFTDSALIGSSGTRSWRRARGLERWMSASQAWQRAALSLWQKMMAGLQSQRAHSRCSVTSPITEEQPLQSAASEFATHTVAFAVWHAWHFMVSLSCLGGCWLLGSAERSWRNNLREACSRKSGSGGLETAEGEGGLCWAPTQFCAFRLFQDDARLGCQRRS